MNYRFIALALAALVLVLPCAFGQAPYVVTTLTPPADGYSSNASRFTTVGNAIYFYADPANEPPAIWKWTQADGAKRVRTLAEGYGLSVSMIALGDKLLFAAQVDSRGNELWITDGTDSGTLLVKDINPAGSSSATLGVVSGGRAFMTAYHSDTGRELWVTDGTEAGTTLVKDLTGDSASSALSDFTVAGGKVFFNAQDQLWVSDGTAAGTITLASGVSGTGLGELNGRAYFLGSDSDHGRELWSSDGTVAGTAMVKDINPGPAASWGGIVTTFGTSATGLLFFTAEDPTNGRELWKTDGTAAGTQLVKDITAGMNPTDITSLVTSDAGAFFVVDKTALWFSDGTDSGTIPVASYPGVWTLRGTSTGAYLVSSEAALYFSTGTAAGTVKLPNVMPRVSLYAGNGGTVLFSGTDGASGYEPWTSDGTVAGTRMLADVGTNSTSTSYQLTWMKAAGSNVFMANGSKLLRSDGTAAGTLQVGTVTADYYYSYGNAVAALGSTLLFTGGTSATAGLWKSNGTVAGTTLVKPFARIDRIFTSSGGYGLVVGYAESTYSDAIGLWRTDGTAAGTTRLVAQNTSNFVDIGGRTYFLAAANYYSSFTELWRTDGTEATTQIVAKGQFTTAGTADGLLYLSNFDAIHGSELWKSDGTGDGLTRVKDIKPGTGSSDPSDLVGVGDLLFFTADDGVHGRELWRSDGTEAGTFMVKEIAAGPYSSYIRNPVASGRYLFFTVDGYLWRSDGTTAGTFPLTDFYSSQSFGFLTPFEGRLLASASDWLHGDELWESDGTPAGTFVFADLVAGQASSYPRNLTLARDLLFFTTADGKLWATSRAATRVTVDDRRVVEGNTGATLVEFTITRDGDLTGATTVDYATADITATAGTDYLAASGSVSFSAGETTKPVTITVVGDTNLEQNELFSLRLTAASGATIVDDRALGIIEEDDRKVALSVEYVPRRPYYYNTQERTFRIANNGPSGATVSLRLSESPFDGTFACGGKNPSTCPVGFVPAGGSVEFTVSRSTGRALAGTGTTPGRTLTATVSAVEAEDDLSDNTIARMLDASGTVALPSFLVAGTTASARATALNGSFPASVQLAVSGGVVVSPGSALVTQNDPVATFGLTVGAGAWGWSNVTSGSTTLMRIPVVLDGEQVKLDTSILTPKESYSSLYFDYDDDVVIPIVVAATLPDGTRPSGMLKLRRKSDDTIVQTLALDADGKATFNLGVLSVGNYLYRVQYDGDDQYNPVTVDLNQVSVNGFSTSTDVVIAEHPCGDSEITVTVYSGGGHTPTGSVKISINGSDVATLPLVATATPGYASAKMSYAYTSQYTTTYANYIPNSPFQASYDYSYNSSPVTCSPPTLIAAAASATSVSLVWTDVGATQYEILRAEAPSRTVFTAVGSTAVANFVDNTAQAGKSYLYKVNAKASGGLVRSTSAADLATTILFADDPIVFRATRVKAAHITQLQQAANAVRALAGLSSVAFTPVTAGSVIRGTDVSSLRSAISEAFSVLGYTVAWVDGVGTGNAIKTVHVQQLRNVVK